VETQGWLNIPKKLLRVAHDNDVIVEWPSDQLAQAPAHLPRVHIHRTHKGELVPLCSQRGDGESNGTASILNGSDGLSHGW
jgi:hypothetical protein